jgi:hypothetical protein
MTLQAVNFAPQLPVYFQKTVEKQTQGYHARSEQRVEVPLSLGSTPTGCL